MGDLDPRIPMTPYERKMVGRKLMNIYEGSVEKESKYSPYFIGKVSAEGRWDPYMKQLTWKELPRHEIVYDKEGNYIPNPRSAPGLIPLLPTSPADLAIETAFLSISEKNPTLAIALGLVPGMMKKMPHTVDVPDVELGHMIGKRFFKKGMERVKSDPMLKDIPFQGTSDVGGPISVFRRANEPTTSLHEGYLGMFHGGEGRDLARALRLGEEYSGYLHLGDPVFKFRTARLSNYLFGRGKGHSAKGHESTVRHEGRHFKQVQELSDFLSTYMPKLHKKPKILPRIKKKKGLHLDIGVTSLWDTPSLSGRFANTLIDIPVPKNAKDSWWVKWDKSKKKSGEYKTIHSRNEVGYSRIEVEARLEELLTMGPKNSQAHYALSDAGYSYDEIRKMLNAYSKARAKVYGRSSEEFYFLPKIPKPRKSQSGFKKRK